MTLFPLWGRKKIMEPANIGKITIIVNQGKKFVVKTRYAWTRKTRAQNNTYIFRARSIKKIKWIQVEFSGTYQ